MEISKTRLPRRTFLTGLVTLAATPALATGTGLRSTSLRGSLDASSFGVRPDTGDDQSRLLQKVLDRADTENKPVFLPPGTYTVSNIDLPIRTNLIGISGSTRLLYGGGGAFLSATGCDRVALEGITLDGLNRPLADTFSGLLNARACREVALEDCIFQGSAGTGVTLDTCGGHIERCTLSGAAGVAGLYALNGTGFSIRDNLVADCANGGILVHRWQAGADNSIVSGNRVRNIAARGGGTGQRGNGINLFRADGVVVTGNHVSDCAFSAIRANSASNAQITSNTCLGSGETAIYAEFAFQGSVISNNLVDGGTIGVSIANFDSGGRMAVCSGNLIRNMVREGPYPAEVAGFGIGIFAEAEAIVSDNVIEGAPQYGIGLGWGRYLRNVIASNNIVRRAGHGIAVTVAEGAGSATIANNLFSDVERGGIFGHRFTEPVTRDLTHRGAERYKHLSVMGNRLT